MKSNSDYITFKSEGRFWHSNPEIEQIVKREMYAALKPDSIVKCYEFESDELLDELPLNVLFNE